MLMPDHARQPLSSEERAGFSDFLRNRRKVPERQIPYVPHWIERFCRFRMASEDTASGDMLTRFLDELSTEKEPWQVDQAGESVRLFEYFLRHGSQEPTASAPDSDAESWKDQFAELTRIVRLKHLSLRTEKAYYGWVRRFRASLGDRPVSSIQPLDVQTFISALAVEQGVSESTQNQAFSALLFFFRHVLKLDLQDQCFPSPTSLWPRTRVLCFSCPRPQRVDRVKTPTFLRAI